MAALAVNVTRAANDIQGGEPAALNALRQLETLGILGPAAEGPRGQLRWRAPEILQLLVADEN